MTIFLQFFDCFSCILKQGYNQLYSQLFNLITSIRSTQSDIWRGLGCVKKQQANWENRKSSLNRTAILSRTNSVSGSSSTFANQSIWRIYSNFEKLWLKKPGKQRVKQKFVKRRHGLHFVGFARGRSLSGQRHLCASWAKIFGQRWEKISKIFMVS